MPDPYLYPDVPVLRNKLEIKTEKTLDLVGAEQSRANMIDKCKKEIAERLDALIGQKVTI